MYYRLLLIFVSFTLFLSCKTELSEEYSRLEVLKKNLSENPSKANRDSLITAYQMLLKEENISPKKGIGFYKALAQLQIDNKVFASAVNSLMESIYKYSGSAAIAENVWLLGEIYDKYYKRPEVVGIIKKLYTLKFPEGANIAVARMVALKDTTPLDQDIIQLGSSMYNEETHQVNYQAANDYIRVCELYALLQPEDPKSADYLHKAGEMARAIRSFPKAVALYDWIYTRYPSFEKSAQALFLKAFTYDNDLQDKETARNLYQEFLAKYPEDDFADDTQFLLDNLGKNDEEIIKSFGQ